jgi:hypothetical protein
MNTTTNNTKTEVTFKYPAEHSDQAFCDDLSHQCHLHKHNVAALRQSVDEGLITEDEEALIFIGRAV